MCILYVVGFVTFTLKYFLYSSSVKCHVYLSYKVQI